MAYLLLLAPSASAETVNPVFVQAGENGQGLLRERNGECFVISPEHVVRGSETISVVSEDRREASARLESSYADDIALLRVLDRDRFPCGMPWDEGRDLDGLLAATTEGVLLSRGPTAAIQRRFVKVVGYNHNSIRIRPASEADAFLKTLSGSVLLLAGRPAGLLLQVEAASGNGSVLRIDHLSNVLRSFFDVRPVSAVAAASGFSVRGDEYRAIATVRTGIYEQPDKLAPTVGRIDVGAVIDVTGQVNERLWIRVQHKGVTGFIPKNSAKPF